MQIITGKLERVPNDARPVPIVVERSTIARYRWRARAADGREFGFALHHTLAHGDTVHAEDGATYVLEQLPEPVVVIALPEKSDAARLGWMIGNLHFPLMVADSEILVPDDAAVRQMLEREGIPYRADTRVFVPAGNVPHHHH